MMSAFLVDVHLNSNVRQALVLMMGQRIILGISKTIKIDCEMVDDKLLPWISLPIYRPKTRL